MVARYITIGLISVSALSACTSTKNNNNSNNTPSEFANFAAAGVAMYEELIALGGPTEEAQNPGGFGTYDGYAGFVRMALVDVDEEQIIGDPESYVDYISQVTLEVDFGNLNILGGSFYNFLDADGSVDGDLEIQTGFLLEDGGILLLSTDAAGIVDGENVDLSIDGGLLGDNAEGAYAWMDGDIGIDPFSGYFVAKR